LRNGPGPQRHHDPVRPQARRPTRYGTLPKSLAEERRVTPSHLGQPKVRIDSRVTANIKIKGHFKKTRFRKNTDASYLL